MTLCVINSEETRVVLVLACLNWLDWPRDGQYNFYVRSPILFANAFVALAFFQPGQTKNPSLVPIVDVIKFLLCEAVGRLKTSCLSTTL